MSGHDNEDPKYTRQRRVRLDRIVRYKIANENISRDAADENDKAERSDGVCWGGGCLVTISFDFF